jgi:hypothetical protein
MLKQDCCGSSLRPICISSHTVATFVVTCKNKMIKASLLAGDKGSVRADEARETIDRRGARASPSCSMRSGRPSRNWTASIEPTHAGRDLRASGKWIHEIAYRQGTTDYKLTRFTADFQHCLHGP